MGENRAPALRFQLPEGIQLRITYFSAVSTLVLVSELFLRSGGIPSRRQEFEFPILLAPPTILPAIHGRFESCEAMQVESRYLREEIRLSSCRNGLAAAGIEGESLMISLLVILLP